MLTLASAVAFAYHLGKLDGHICKCHHDASRSVLMTRSKAQDAKALCGLMEEASSAWHGAGALPPAPAELLASVDLTKARLDRASFPEETVSKIPFSGAASLGARRVHKPD